jgi:hypothetical protein
MIEPMLEPRGGAPSGGRTRGKPASVAPQRHFIASPVPLRVTSLARKWIGRQTNDRVLAGALLDQAAACVTDNRRDDGADACGWAR